MKKLLLSIVLSLFAVMASAQTATCAITHRNDNAWQGQLDARLGAVPLNPDYTWSMTFAFVIQPGTVFKTGSKVVFPTMGTGNGYGNITKANVSLYFVGDYSAEETCAGMGPQAMAAQLGSLVVKKSVPIPTGDVVFTLNAATVAALNAKVAQANLDSTYATAVFAVYQKVNRVYKYVKYPGIPWDDKKTNQTGTVIDFARATPCNGMPSPYCPSLTY